MRSTRGSVYDFIALLLFIPAFMILYIKDEFTALVGKLFSAYYGTFSMAFATLHGFCRDQNSSINSYPWSVLKPFCSFFTFLSLSSELNDLRRSWRGFRRLDTVLWCFCFTCITLLMPHDLCWMEMVHPYLGLGVKRDGMNRKDINFWLLSGNLLDEEKGVLIDRRARG
jgi:hypothetical protein